MSDEIKEAILYLEHTSKDDFNLEEHQKENRIWAIKVLLDYITNLQEMLDNIRKIIDNEKITGIEARLMIQDIFERGYQVKDCGINDDWDE